MREMPTMLEDALDLAVKQHSVETAQQRLHREMRHEGAVAMALQQEGTVAEERGTGSNAVAPTRCQDPPPTTEWTKWQESCAASR